MATPRAGTAVWEEWAGSNPSTPPAGAGWWASISGVWPPHWPSLPVESFARAAEDLGSTPSF